jgi:hypothetical protein
MEDNFLKDDFEQFLKGSADEFLMVPQRKVWYSIYNSMHPDRKWPSLAVCLLILSAVLFIGISNNNSISDAARKAGAENMSSIAKNRADKGNNKRSMQLSKLSTAGLNASTTTYESTSNTSAEDVAITDNTQYDSPERLPALTENTGTTPLTGSASNIGSDHTNIPVPSSRPNEERGVVILAAANSTTQQNHVPASSVNVKAGTKANAPSVPDADNDLQISNALPAGAALVNTALPAAAVANNDVAVNDKKNNTHSNSAKIAVLTNDQRAWIEDFAFHNQAGKSKFKKNASFTYYVTPSLGYRTIIRKTGYTPAGSLVLASRSVPSLHESLLDGAALNLETGVALNYSVAKNIKLKGGLQFNYTNYITTGTELGHPTQTSVALMSNAPQMLRSTTFSVDGDQDKFNHRSIQVSIPIGADVKITGNDKLNWYLGATAQPTFIIGGKSLVLSADEKNLITENTLRRNWNLNMAVETFISYKTRSGVVFNAGPQFRYQMLSTFKKQYAYNERPYNLGIKLGITKGF